MSRRWFGRWIAVLLASAVAIVAPVPMLTSTAAAAEPAVPAVPASYLNQTIAWSDCSGDLSSRCAKVRVPMDWQNPSKGSISIAIAYLKASGTSKGLLTTNPGGPGAAGRTFTEALYWSKPKLGQYDLLGFDPRGYGASTNVKCVTTTAKYNKLPKVADRRSRTKATHAVEVAEAKLFAESCSSDPLARYINTQQTVWDVDFLRQLLAKNQGRSYPVRNYVGYSYGTWLGAWYADTYPNNVGKFILDSNMQWTASMYTNQALDSMSFQRRRDKMLFPYLARHNAEFGLGKSAKSVKKKYEKTRKKLAALAKKDLKKGKTPRLGPEDFDYTVAQYIYTDAGFDYAGGVIEAATDLVKKPSSSKYQKRLASKVKAPMTKAPFSVQRTAKSVGNAKKDITAGLSGAVVRCNDSANSSNIKALQKRADKDAKKYPFMGYLNTVSLCAYWKFKPQTRTIDFAGLPSKNKIVMFQSEGDPATAYEGARAAHRKTASKTVMISVDNEGQHGLYIDGPSKCVETIGDAFLFSNKTPAKDATCTTSPLYYDKKVYTLSGPVSGAKSTAKSVIKPKNATVKAVRADSAKRGLS